MTTRLALVLVAAAAATASAGIDAEVGNGDAISGTLSPAGEVETFRARIPKDAKILVKAKSAKKGPALRVVLLPPSAAALGSADGRAASIRVTAPSSGLYAVTVESSDGTTAGDYSLTISWKSRTAYSVTTTPLLAGAGASLDFAADTNATARIAVRPAFSSPAAGGLVSLTAPDSSVAALTGAAVKTTLTRGGGWSVAFRNIGAAEGGLTAVVKLTPPKFLKRKVNLTSKAIGSGNSLGDAAIAALFDGSGGTLTFPNLPQGQPGSEISGSSVTVPQGALGGTTTIVIATAPPVAPGGGEDAAGPTVLFGPEGMKFDSVDKHATATVTIPYDPSFDSATATFVVYTRDAKGKITAVPQPYTFDHTAHTVSFATSHFSSFRAGGTAPQQQNLTLNTLAALVDPRDVCAANDPGTALPIRYFVANGIGLSVVALRTSQPPGPAVTPELYAGGGTDPSPGSPRQLFEFTDPVQSVYALQTGQLFIATTTQIYTVDAAGNVQLVAGTGQTGNGGDNGPAQAATFTSINSILVSSRILVCDAGAHRIRVIDPANNNTITAWAGTGVQAVGADTVDVLTTTFVGPSDMAFDGAGPGLYVTDGGRVRHLVPGSPIANGGVNVTVAGDAGGATGSGGDGGTLLKARFTSLSGIALYPDPFHPNDTVLVVCDRADHTLRKLDLTTDVVTLVAGQHGTPGFGADADVATGLINTPLQVITETSDITFIDSANSRVRVQTLQQ